MKNQNNGPLSGRTSINLNQLRISAVGNNSNIGSLNGSVLLSPHVHAIHLFTNETPPRKFDTSRKESPEVVSTNL